MRLVEKLYLSEILDKLQSETLSYEQFLKEVCARFKEKDDIIKSFLPEKNRCERVLGELQKLKRKFPDKKQRPPLFGIPVGIKDIFHVQGFKTQAGSTLPWEHITGKEGSLIKKLKDYGAIIFGKTVTTEFAYFKPGPTKNPHNILYTPGGSSSGSAAAVSAGIVPLAFGTQTIGSISRPASYCGVVGYKPSFNRISMDGVLPFSPSVDHIGFLHRIWKVADL